MPLMGLTSHAEKSGGQRPFSSTFASRTGLASAIRYMSPGVHHEVGRKDDSPKSRSPMPTPPASPPQFKRPLSTADVLYMHEDSSAEVTVIQRATRVPIVTQSNGNLREVIYHKGRPVYRPGSP